MKKNNIFFISLENPGDGLSWNRNLVKKPGGTRFQIGDKEYDFNADIQHSVSNTSPDLDSLSNDDLIAVIDIPQRVDYENDKPRVGATNSKSSVY